jgi:hypothetical protein
MAYSPAYYKRGSIEVWDFIRDQGLNYHLGNAIKYICRAGYKGSKADDLRKAIHYLQNELDNETDSRGAGKRISEAVSDLKQPFPYFEDYATDFDR